MKSYKFINKKAEQVDLYIEGEIADKVSAEIIREWLGDNATSCWDFEQQLKECGNKPINVHINSFGGDLFEGIAMYTALKNYKGPKTAYIKSVCASAATYPAIACDKVLMSAPALFCVHLPMTYAQGNRMDFEEAIKQLQPAEEACINAYVRKTGMDRESIRSLMEENRFMDSQEAIKLGFVDGLMEDEYNGDPVLTNIRQSFNIQVFNRMKPTQVKEPVVNNQEEEEKQKEQLMLKIKLLKLKKRK